jgi:CelD/BcsL family acetyltransferase involved in cellulose biosynthesis
MRVALDLVSDRNALLEEWQSVERVVQPSVFLSSEWIGSLLETLPTQQPLYRATFWAAGAIAGLAVFGRARVSSRIASHEALTLNATGVEEFDVVHIEMNGLLVPGNLVESAAEALLRAIERELPDIDCVQLQGMSEAAPYIRASASVGWIADVATLAAPYVDLLEVTARGGDYLGLLRKKARYAARRARTAYVSRYGELRVVPAVQIGDVETAFAQMEDWSATRWKRLGGRSSFELRYFRDFHLRLLDRGRNTGAAQLLGVFAGDQRIASIYLLQRHKWVCFYQAGYDYALLGDDARPGFAALPAVIEHCAAQGDRVFDFLAEPTLYKRDLATKTRDMSWLTLLRPTIRNRLLHTARTLKRSFVSANSRSYVSRAEKT